MLSKCVFLVLTLSVACANKSCYFNNHCSYHLFSSKTPYDAIRGDIRDIQKDSNCEAVSLWHLQRHGNRNPGGSVTEQIKVLAGLKDQIVQSYDAGRSQLCAQDIDLFRRWSWNSTIEVSTSFLSGVGYEEIFNIAKRIRETYPELLSGNSTDYYLRSTNEQRTVTSGIAYIHGLTDGTNLTVTADDVREQDEVIRPYDNCDRYQQEVKSGPLGTAAMEAYMNSSQYLAVRDAVQQRLAISYQLTPEDIYGIYELCRFYRSWEPDLRSPWCSVFSDEDLLVLEYRDDVRHYYRNGYGSWVNIRLGELTLKDLFDSLSLARNGSSRKLTAYFTHDAMMEMVYSALGLYREEAPLRGDDIKQDRNWRTSRVAAMASNLIFVLNRCQESGTEVYRVQIFNNERVTELCPLNGCTWSEFQDKFQRYTNASLDFCSLDYPEPEESENVNNAVLLRSTLSLLFATMLIFVLK